MNTTFQQLSEMRKYWIKSGHKHVPHPDCCCGYASPTSRSIINGTQIYTCPIHLGFYYLCYRYLIVLFLVLSKYICKALIASSKSLNGPAYKLNQLVRTFEHKYYDKDLSRETHTSRLDNRLRIHQN